MNKIPLVQKIANLEKMKKICGSDGYWSFEKPFTFGQYAYATDDVVMVRMDMLILPDIKNKNPSRLPNVTVVFNDDVLRKSKFNTKLTVGGRDNKCRICSGLGIDVFIDTDIPCANCDGTGSTHVAYIDGIPFDLTRIEMIISEFGNECGNIRMGISSDKRKMVFSAGKYVCGCLAKLAW